MYTHTFVVLGRVTYVGGWRSDRIGLCCDTVKLATDACVSTLDLWFLSVDLRADYC